MDKIINVILDQIRKYNEIADEQVDIGAGEDSILFGQGSPLDSVSFVSLMLDIEQAINEELQKDVVLVDTRAMSQKSSPFRTVGSLAHYIAETVEGAK